jgi:hypothetical protein
MLPQLQEPRMVFEESMMIERPSKISIEIVLGNHLLRRDEFVVDVLVPSQEVHN